MTTLVTGLVLGVAGSGHCAGMCGPLAVTLTSGLRPASRGTRMRQLLLYHGGRILTYVALGVPAGLAGRAVSMAGYDRLLAVGAGTVLLLFAAGSVRPRLLGPAGRLAAAAAARACAAAHRWNRSHPIAGPVAAGAANGLVPCGLVYAAVTAAAAMGSAGEAALLMLGFGLGTVPALLAVSLAAVSFAPVLRMRLRQAGPILLVLAAALLIGRGLTSHSHRAADRTPAAVAAHH